MIFDPLYFLAPGLLLMVWAQWRVKRVCTAYSRVGDRAGLTGAQAARFILDTAGLTDVPVVSIAGELTGNDDHSGRESRCARLVWSTATRNMRSVRYCARRPGPTTPVSPPRC